MCLHCAGRVAGVAGTPGAQAFDWRAASALGGDGSGVGNQNVGSFNGVYNGNVRSRSSPPALRGVADEV